MVEQAIASPQNAVCTTVRLDNAAPGIQVNDPDATVVEQTGEGRTHGLGRSQRLAHLHELTDVGYEAPDGGELPGLPAAGGRIGEGPDDAQAVQPIQAHVQAVLGAGVAQTVVVHRRGLQLALGVEVRDVYQAAVGQLAQTRQTFVPRVVELEIVALQVLAALAALVEAGKQDADVVAGALGNHQLVAGHAAGVVDEGGGCGPVGVVEHGLVQGGKDAVISVELVHAVSWPFGLRCPALS